MSADGRRRLALALMFGSPALAAAITIAFGVGTAYWFVPWGMFRRVALANAFLASAASACGAALLPSPSQSRVAAGIAAALLSPLAYAAALFLALAALFRFSDFAD